MEAHRLRAPSDDGSLVVEPPLAEAPRLLSANAARLAAWTLDVQGRPADRLRDSARRQVLDKARAFLRASGFDPPLGGHGDGSGPLVVSGHQPELFHPGVWVKNFAADRLARLTGARSLNLIIDNDIPKAPGVRVPFRAADGTLHTERVGFDHWQGEVPYEDLAVADEPTFASFGERVRERLRGLVADPLVEDFWPRAVEARARTDRLGMRFALARHGVEVGWGVNNLELPLSAVCETDAFFWFASHLLAHLDRFQQVHNDALGRYREVYGIRSRHHPVPDLAREGDWREAPFWAWRAAAPRRRPLLVRRRSNTMELRIRGEDELLRELPLAPDREACCAVERLAELPARGVRLRTRALTTTMFARLFLGDLFLHGIGGAKYDELGDEIVRGFFGLEPPPYLSMSLTLWLGLLHDGGAALRLEQAERLARKLTYNPDRFLDGQAERDPEAARWAAARQAAVEGPTATHAQRLARFQEIRRCNEALRPFVAGRLASLEAERQSLADDARVAAVARSREFALVLHSQARLRSAMEGVLSPLRDLPEA